MAGGVVFVVLALSCDANRHTASLDYPRGYLAEWHRVVVVLSAVLRVRARRRGRSLGRLGLFAKCEWPRSHPTLFRFTLFVGEAADLSEFRHFGENMLLIPKLRSTICHQPITSSGLPNPTWCSTKPQPASHAQPCRTHQHERQHLNHPSISISISINQSSPVPTNKQDPIDDRSSGNSHTVCF
jgi:hypothetical protein